MYAEKKSGRIITVSSLIFSFLVTILGSGHFTHATETVQVEKIPAKTVRTGKSASFTCIVTDGEASEFLWLKGGQLIRQDAKFRININPENSLLTVRNVDQNDAGIYTCVAKNSFSEDRTTAILRVEGPPSWASDLQKEVVASLNQPLNVKCDVISYPQATITWQRVDLGDNTHLQSEPDGTLHFSNVTRDDVGTYKCTAKNTLGEIHKEVKVVVRVPAKIPSGHKYAPVTVRRGDTAVLKCEALGDSPLNITWKKGEQVITLDTPRMEVIENTFEGGINSELQVASTDRADNGLFTCTAANAYGDDKRTIKLSVLEAPGAPIDVKVIETFSNSIRLRWAAPYGSTSVTKYIIQYWKHHGSAYRLHEQEVEAASQLTATLTGLRPGSDYNVRVAAVNAVGSGHHSDSVRFRTSDEKPSAPPTDIIAEPKGPTVIRVRWKAPPKDQWNGDITKYYIGYRPVGASLNYTYQTAAATRQQEEEHLLSGLKRGTEYSIVVAAENSVGSGPLSQDILSRTSDTEPPRPPRISLEGTGRTSITIKYQELPGPQAQHFILSYREQSGPWRELTIPRTSDQRYTLSGLREGTSYELKLLAEGEGSTSEASETMTVLTEGSLSDAIFPRGSAGGQGDLPVYLRWTILAPTLASLGIITIVSLIACCLVSRERKKYKNMVVIGEFPHVTYDVPPGTVPLKGGSVPVGTLMPNAQMTIMRPAGAGATTRYVDVEKYGMVVAPQDCPLLPGQQFPIPYATLPVRQPLGHPGAAAMRPRAGSQDVVLEEGQYGDHHYDIAG
ncbi:Down syndrome cell adhesion molecule homolog isoform X3 [Varroa jacobsoni]|uniref:Down syndrome cell adhesion molecule homolog isoform X3 n=1 Tax=Varroa jacobsoni TaxID=62625 RepID=UPI000BF6DB1A|nr:Down syndrome cell adhesion molecule homolog isoform X3 [Varroa jacobsoni]